MIRIAFFNHSGGAGKTSLVYHCAWMWAEMGRRVLAVDLDPQSKLSMMAVATDRLEELWLREGEAQTVYGAVAPLVCGNGEARPAHIEEIGHGLGLLVGDLALARTEEAFAMEWPQCEDGSERAFRVTTALGQMMQEAAERFAADVTLVNIGPNLGAINRAALLAASHMVVPVAPDLFSLQGLRNLGPVLRGWRDGWQEARRKAGRALAAMPSGEMAPVGYVLLQHAERLGRPTPWSSTWPRRIAEGYQQSVLGETGPVGSPDANQIALMRRYQGLRSLAMEARKPMFQLTGADGAMGVHQMSVQQCGGEYERLCREIGRRVGWAG